MNIMKITKKKKKKKKFLPNSGKHQTDCPLRAVTPSGVTALNLCLDTSDRTLFDNDF